MIISRCIYALWMSFVFEFRIISFISVFKVFLGPSAAVSGTDAGDSEEVQAAGAAGRD
jgi:hypothetical protein